MSDPGRVLVLAPNWVGDAVMALPAVADVRRAFPSARVIAAARRPVDEIFRLAPAVDEVVTLQGGWRWWRRAAFTADAARLQAASADVAILLPNSFASAWLARRADIPTRWGYAADWRGTLLSRAIRRPGGRLHQGAYYQHLTRALGIDSGPLEPELAVSASALASGRAQLIEAGWDGRSALVVCAPGAAFGGAKRWLPAHMARLATELVSRRDATCVLVGGPGDAPVAGQIVEAIATEAASRVIDMTGCTIEMMAGIMRLAQVCVSNDSGAMHVAAALGTPIVALFGPTDERQTSPLMHAGARADVLTHPVWCRPCGLRECPIDHRCMTRITPERVFASVDAMLSSTV